MVEREFELEQLRAALTEAAGGTGQVVVVRGAVASGKTELVRHFTEQVISSGAKLLHASGSRIERDLSLEVVRQLFAREEFDADARRTTTGLLDHEVLTRAGTDQTLRSSVLHGLSSVILDQAERIPVVIAVDDVQYLDTFSQEWLLYLIRRATSARILVVLCWREGLDGTAGGHRLFYAELYSQANCRHLQLAMLSRDGVAALLAERFGPDIAARLADGWYRVSGGNPLLAQTLLDDHCAAAPGEPLAEPVEPVEHGIGDAFVQGVLIILYRGEPTTYYVACALAVLGEAAEPARLGHLSGIAPDRVAAALDLLTRIGLLESGRFRHPIMRSTVLDSMPVDERADAHWRAAGLLRADGVDATTVAGHLVATGRLDRADTVSALLEVAEQMLADGRTAAAVDLLRGAYQANSGERRGVRILAMLVRAEWRINFANVLRYLPELTDAVLDGRLRGRDALMTIMFLLWHGRVGDAVAALSRITGSTAEPDTDTARAVGLAWRWLSITYPAVLRRGVVEPRPPVPTVAPTVSIGQRMVDALGGILADGPSEDAVAHAQHVLRHHRLAEATLVPLVSALLTLLYAERLDEADRRCRRLLRSALSGQTPTWYAPFAAVAAEISLRRGSLMAAENYAHSALTHLPVADWGVVVGFPLGSIVLAQTLLGKYDKAAKQLAQRVPDVMFETPCGLHYVLARGRYHLAVNLPQAALDDFQACGDLLGEWGLDLAGMVPWRAEIANAYLQLGEHERAGQFAQDQLRRLGTTRHSRTRGRSLRLLAATREPSRRPRLLWEAVDLLQRCGDRFELASAFADLHRTYRLLGQTSQARSVARKANSVAKAYDAERSTPTALVVPDLTREDELDRTGPGAASSRLSEAERRVAVLAVQGHTNREIAGELYVTTSTVEQHLTHIYRKLGVNRRADLVAHLGPEVVSPFGSGTPLPEPADADTFLYPARSAG